MYLVLAIAFIVSSFQKKGTFELQVILQLIVDITVLTLMIYSSGGLGSGLGVLLVVVVVTGEHSCRGDLHFLLLRLRQYQY
ncbi:MAG: hypothetical protein Q9N32_08035 [Gammaproteobacteria bacterium]|nr:hypothetical protein [Gammaproteobacteria bacterium]